MTGDRKNERAPLALVFFNRGNLFTIALAIVGLGIALAAILRPDWLEYLTPALAVIMAVLVLAHRFCYTKLAQHYGDQNDLVPTLTNRLDQLKSQLSKVFPESEFQKSQIGDLSVAHDGMSESLAGITADCKAQFENTTASIELHGTQISDLLDGQESTTTSLSNLTLGHDAHAENLRQLGDRLDLRIAALGAEIRKLTESVELTVTECGSLQDQISDTRLPHQISGNALGRHVEDNVAEFKSVFVYIDTQIAESKALKNKIAEIETATISIFPENERRLSEIVKRQEEVNSTLISSIAENRSQLEAKDRTTFDYIASVESTLGQSLEVLQGSINRVNSEVNRVYDRIGVITDEVYGNQPELSRGLPGIEYTLQRMQASYRDSLVTGDVAAQNAAQTRLAFARYDTFDPETEVLPVLFAHSPAPASAVDVGAHRGVFSNALLNAGFDVEAYEPNSELAKELLDRSGHRESLRIHQMACGDSDGVATLYLAEPAAKFDSSLFSTLSQREPFNGLVFDRTEKVRTVRLDEHLSELGVEYVSVLKIDAEGLDEQVLAGAKGIFVGNLMMEFWSDGYSLAGPHNDNSIGHRIATIGDRYSRWLVFWRGDRADHYGVDFQAKQAPDGSWGNILFYNDDALHVNLQEWAVATYGSHRINL